jgi:hypothetical protein
MNDDLLSRTTKVMARTDCTWHKAMQHEPCFLIAGHIALCGDRVARAGYVDNRERGNDPVLRGVNLAPWRRRSHP